MASAPPQETVDVGRVLGRGLTALRDNFLPFLAVSLWLAGLPAFAVQYWTRSDWAALGNLLIWFIANVLLQGVLVRSTVLHLSGRDADVGASALLAVRLLPLLLVLSVLLSLMIGIGLVLLIVPGLMIYCATIVAVPALIEERSGIFGSIGRSRALTRDSRWQIFGLAVLLWIFGTVVQNLAARIADLAATAPADPLAAGVAIGIGTSLSTMIGAVVVAALYVELREVREGASTSELADVFA